jgi:hypothetical protein
MKKIILFVLFNLLFVLNTNAQINVTYDVLGTTFTYQPISLNQHNFMFQSKFSFGSGYCNNIMTGSQIEINGNTLLVKAFYDITGVWPAQGCVSYNTIAYNQIIPNAIQYIKMSTNVITYDNNPPYNPVTVPDVYFRIIDLSTLSINQNDTNDIVKVFPNPTTGIININFGQMLDQATLKLTNVLGQVVSSKTFSNLESTTFEIKETNGIYFLEIESQNNERKIFKIIKN